MPVQNMPGCCCQKCCSCLAVTIAGVTKGSCGCFYCDNINGTFELPRTLDSSSLCVWEGTLCSTGQTLGACALAALRAHLSKNEDDEWIFRVVLGVDGGTRMVWENNFGSTKPSCTALAAASIPLVEAVFTAPDTENDICDGAGSTLTVSSLAECTAGPLCDGGHCKEVCDSRRTPDAIEVTIPASWVNDLCTDCNARLSGTFILDRAACYVPGAFGMVPVATGCCYEYRDFVGGNCTVFRLVAEFRKYGGVPCLIIEMQLGALFSPQVTIRWRLELATICDLGDCLLDAGPYDADFCCWSGGSPNGFGGISFLCKWDAMASTDGFTCAGETCPGSISGYEAIQVTAA